MRQKNKKKWNILERLAFVFKIKTPAFVSLRSTPKVFGGGGGLRTCPPKPAISFIKRVMLY
jgi:hypothetical protein